MDRGFAGIVAVAVLGCAVVLAIAFQISEGLAMETARRESGSAEAPAGARPLSGGADGFAGPEVARELPPETAPAEASGLEQAEDTASAAPESGNMASARQGTPLPAKEINPAEGHTVSPRTADEIGERARTGPLPQPAQTRIPNVKSNDPSSSRAPQLEVPSGTAGAAAGQAAPAIEMIRGTRRSTEPVAASENED